MSEVMQDDRGTTDGVVVPDPRGSVQKKIEKLSDDLDRRGAEIDSLQVELSKKARPFYKDPPLIVAALALIASLFATYLSQTAATEGRILEQRGRLTTLVKDITDWQKSAVTDSNVVDAGVRSNLNEATFLIDVLEPTESRSAASEKTVVASAWIQVYEPARAVVLASSGEVQASQSTELTPTERNAVTRALAQGLYASNRPQEGSAAYRRSIGYLDSGASTLDRDYLAPLYLWTHKEWAVSALSANDCPTAKYAIGQMRVDFTRFPVRGPGSWADMAQPHIAQVESTCG